MSKTETEMFPLFSRLYKKGVLYILFVITIAVGLGTAIMEFIFGNLFWAFFYLLIAIYWNAAVFFPFIKNATGHKLLNKKNPDKPLKKNYVLIERIISLLLIIIGISFFCITITGGRHWAYIFSTLWFTLLGFCHFSFILFTRIASKPKRPWYQ